ncbi:MAG: ABC transporter ATP-binding protein [Candidatus Acidiferrales bacterium]
MSSAPTSVTPSNAPAAAARSLSVSFDRIEKRFGTLFALRGISLEIQPGEFVALLGPNGAGKTTLLRIAALLATPTRGHVRFTLGSRSAGAQESAKKLIGMVGHNPLLYEDLTAAENLKLFAQLYGLNDPVACAARGLESCRLADRANGIVRTFSRGMRQRLALARALLHGPSLLLLDEPGTGLDRQAIAWLGETLARLHREGCTMIMSTHARSESLELATRAVRLSGGRVGEDTLGGDPGPLLARLRSDLPAGRQGIE